MKILIIESDATFAQAAAEALRERGADPTILDDGEAGMEHARATRPALILLSVELGERLHGGYSWCNRFKKDDELKEIPILLVSANATQETFDQHRKLRTRADGYLIKPFPMETLLEEVETLAPGLAGAAASPLVPPSPPPLNETNRYDFAWPSEESDDASLDGADEPLFPGDEPQQEAAGVEHEELDLGDLFAQNTEQFASNPLDDVLSAPVATDTPSVLGAPAGAAVGQAAAGTLPPPTPAAPAPAAPAGPDPRVEALSASLREQEAVNEELRERLQQALSSRDAAREETRLAEERAEKATASRDAARQEAINAEERAKKAIASREEAQRQVMEIRAQVEAAASWKERAAELEEAVAALEAEIEGFRQRAEQDEELRKRAQKAVAVAADLLGRVSDLVPP